MAVEKYKLLAIQTALTTGSTRANNTQSIGPTIDNSQGVANCDGAGLADVELAGAFGSAPSAGAITLWFLGAPDGTNFELGDGGDGGAGDTTPARAPDLVFPVQAATVQRQVQRTVLPAGKFKVLIRNEGTAQTLSAGATIKLRAIQREIA